MPTPQSSDELLLEAVDALNTHGTKAAAAAALGLPRQTFCSRLNRAAERGLMGTEPVLPGFAIKSIASKVGDAWVKQTKAPGEVFELPAGFAHKRISNLSDGQGRTVARWDIVEQDKAAQLSAMKAAVAAFKEDIPRAAAVAAPEHTIADLLCQYLITDTHLGALAWNEETGGGDYDLQIGERLIVDWFAAAIASAPPAERGVFAQLGDFLHYDSFKSITPEHGHQLDGDTRYPKMVRAAIRIVRRVIAMLLEKHARLDVIMSDANHDPSGEVWLREMFAAFLDDEPRVTVDTSPGTYSALQHGDVSLFYHHGHRRGTSNVDSVLAGKFRELYGKTRYSYAHIGHRHSDELKSTNLMKVEQHETLAAPDAYAANGGWLSGRSAKVITYHKRHGEVGRIVLTPEMVLGAAGPANDNDMQERKAA